MSTYLSKTGELKPEWHVVDASGMVLGRLAARIALILQGKHKPTYTPHVDTGDYVIVLNADKVRVTGRKAEVLAYQTFTEYPSGQKLWPYKTMIVRRPEKVFEVTVRRMLPKSRLGRKFLAKLKIYRGAVHPHQAQQPKELKFS
ncbi:MAG: 50S ribosomal protein L13 [Tepidisphaeraceae bacterium]|jgi:large subunit ribosomal protein L13